MSPSEENIKTKVKFLQVMIIISTLQVDHLDISVVIAHIHGDN